MHFGAVLDHAVANSLSTWESAPAYMSKGPRLPTGGRKFSKYPELPTKMPLGKMTPDFFEKTCVPNVSNGPRPGPDPRNRNVFYLSGEYLERAPRRRNLDISIEMEQFLEDSGVVACAFVCL